MVSALNQTQALELETAPVEPRLIDTHAHLHFEAFTGMVDKVLHSAAEAGVGKIITVGVNTADSRKAVDLSDIYANVYAAVGIHPHDANEIEQGSRYLADLAKSRKVVAIGECGFDFFKSKTSPEQQETALRAQVELALELNRPLIFHVREGFDHFFKVMADYEGVRGVVHSFSDNRANMEKVVENGWLIALNGIMTFTKQDDQLEAARHVPIDNLLLETDCPFLSPAPHRGKTNEPARVADIASFLSQLRQEPVAQLAAATTRNAESLFNL